MERLWRRRLIVCLTVAREKEEEKDRGREWTARNRATENGGEWAAGANRMNDIYSARDRTPMYVLYCVRRTRGLAAAAGKARANIYCRADRSSGRGVWAPVKSEHAARRNVME